jgi:hypothetical protein
MGSGTEQIRGIRPVWDFRLQFSFIGDVHGCIDEFKALDEQPPSATPTTTPDERTNAAQSAWSLLRETFECRDFDDSLVFAE